MLINVEKFKHQALNTHPFRWGYYEDFFRISCVDSLVASFPQTGYELRESFRDDKSYKMFHKMLYDSRLGGLIETTDVGPLWLGLIDELISPFYIASLSSLTDTNLLNYDIEINCWKYGQGCWLSPHTDKPEKAVSQLFYFNNVWDKDWGGSFRVLNDNDISNYYAEIFPMRGNSVVLIRDDKSWHGVPLQNSPETIFRCVLQLIFWKRLGENGSAFSDSYI